MTEIDKLKDQNQLQSQLEKDMLNLAMQGYGIIKKYINQRKASKEVCVKCGSSSIATDFCKTDHAHDNRFNISLKHGTEERLHKTCESCGYSYLMKPLDAKQ